MNSGSDLVPVDLAGAFIEPHFLKNQVGKVIGITSKGIFLLFDGRVLFLTSETHRNPFMLHILNSADYPQNISANQEVRLEDQMLSVGEKKYDLHSISRIVPDPIPLHNLAETHHKSSALIVTLFQTLSLPTHNDSLLYIVDGLLTGKEPLDPMQQNIWAAVSQLRQGVRSQNLDLCGMALYRLMGNGKGLTPSGDDLICGFLLVLNSINPASARESGFISALNNLGVSMAQTRTSWISANLIEASTKRLADERVGRVARLLLGSCRMDAVIIARGLESFGNSSGIDAFAGMAAALLP